MTRSGPIFVKSQVEKFVHVCVNWRAGGRNTIQRSIFHVYYIYEFECTEVSKIFGNFLISMRSLAGFSQLFWYAWLVALVWTRKWICYLEPILGSCCAYGAVVYVKNINRSCVTGDVLSRSLTNWKHIHTWISTPIRAVLGVWKQFIRTDWRAEKSI